MNKHTTDARVEKLKNIVKNAIEKNRIPLIYKRDFKKVYYTLGNKKYDEYGEHLNISESCEFDKCDNKFHPLFENKIDAEKYLDSLDYGYTYEVIEIGVFNGK